MTLRSPLSGRIRDRSLAVVSLCARATLSVPSASAIEPPQKKARPGLAGFRSELLEVGPSLRTIEPAALDPARAAAFQRLIDLTAPEWEVRWDDRADRAHLVQGVGFPLLPASARDASLADVERLLRAFLQEHGELLGVDGRSLRLDSERSLALGNGRVWSVEFQQMHRGIPVDGASVFFRINNGNIVQFGSERVAAVRIAPNPALPAAEAFARLLAGLGVPAAEVRETVDAGTLR